MSEHWAVRQYFDCRFYLSTGYCNFALLIASY